MLKVEFPEFPELQFLHKIFWNAAIPADSRSWAIAKISDDSNKVPICGAI
jgi:hypothetical protein